MAHNGQLYPGNHVDLLPDSSLDITLSMRGELTPCGSPSAPTKAELNEDPSTFIFGSPPRHSSPPIKNEEELPPFRFSCTRGHGKHLQQGWNFTPCPGIVPLVDPATKHPIQEYQMQLMLLEQQKKKRELMTKQEGAPLLSSTIDPIIQSSQTSTTYEPALQAYRTQLEFLDQQFKRNLQFQQNVQSMAPQVVKPETDPSPNNYPLCQKRSHQGHEMELRRPSAAATDYQRQLMQLELENKRRIENEKHLGPPVPPDPASPDLLAQALYDCRLREYHSRMSPVRTCYALPSVQPGSMPPDYQTQLMLLEQQNKRRLIQTKHQAQPARQGTSTPDYQMQLMLLEQQNKRRLMSAKMGP